jgi:hypothetical protein
MTSSKQPKPEFEFRPKAEISVEVPLSAETDYKTAQNRFIKHKIVYFFTFSRHSLFPE